MGGRALKLSILCISGFLFISHTANTTRRDGAGEGLTILLNSSMEQDQDK